MPSINENINYGDFYLPPQGGISKINPKYRTMLYNWNNQQEAIGLPMLPYDYYGTVPQAAPNKVFIDPNAPAYEGGVYTQQEIDRAKGWADALNKKLGNIFLPTTKMDKGGQ